MEEDKLIVEDVKDADEDKLRMKKRRKLAEKDKGGGTEELTAEENKLIKQ